MKVFIQVLNSKGVSYCVSSNFFFSIDVLRIYVMLRDKKNTGVEITKT